MGSNPVSLIPIHYVDGILREYMLELNSFIFILPLMGIIYLLVLPRNNVEKLKKTALEWSLFTLTATILL